jgi:uncharacterized protein YuzE
MKISYDPKADAIYITLRNNGVERTERVGPDIAIDYGPDGDIRGIELLSVSKRFGICPSKPKVILEEITAVKG